MPYIRAYIRHTPSFSYWEIILKVGDDDGDYLGLGCIRSFSLPAGDLVFL
jgi:hypothetical protein